MAERAGTTVCGSDSGRRRQDETRTRTRKRRTIFRRARCPNHTRHQWQHVLSLAPSGVGQRSTHTPSATGGRLLREQGMHKTLKKQYYRKRWQYHAEQTL